MKKENSFLSFFISPRTLPILIQFNVWCLLHISFYEKTNCWCEVEKKVSRLLLCVYEQSNVKSLIWIRTLPDISFHGGWTIFIQSKRYSIFGIFFFYFPSPICIFFTVAFFNFLFLFYTCHNRKNNTNFWNKIFSVIQLVLRSMLLFSNFMSKNIQK